MVLLVVGVLKNLPGDEVDMVLWVVLTTGTVSNPGA
jgi:hypothetical protein